MVTDEIIKNIKERIEALNRDRQGYIEQANLQLAAFDGACQELTAMLEYFEQKQKDTALLVEEQ